MISNVAVNISNGHRPMGVDVLIGSQNDYVVLDPEYGEPIMLWLSGNDLDALVLEFVDIDGNEQKFLLAAVP